MAYYEMPKATRELVEANYGGSYAIAIADYIGGNEDLELPEELPAVPPACEELAKRLFCDALAFECAMLGDDNRTGLAEPYQELLDWVCVAVFELK